MRGALRIGQGVWSGVRRYLLASTDERMAYLLARASRWADPADESTIDFLVTRAIPVPDAALAVQNKVRVEVDPGFTREVLIACYETGLSLVDVHTHPFSTDQVAFSGHDVSNMRSTHAEFLSRIPNQPMVGVASLVIGQASVAGSFTHPDTGALQSLNRFTVLGDSAQEVPLCGI